MKKRIIFTVLTIMIVVGVWGAFNREKATQMVVDLGMWMTSSMKHRNPGKEQPKFKMNSNDLSVEFERSEPLATKKFIDQVVLVDGEVSAMHGVNVSLTNISCNIDSTEINKIKELKVGTKVKVQGLVVGYNNLLGEVNLAECTLK